MASLFPSYYPGHYNLSVTFTEEGVVINGMKYQNYQKSIVPLDDNDFGKELSYAGTICVSKSLNYNGPMIIIGRRSRDGIFRVSDELLTCFKCKPYPEVKTETLKIDVSPSYMMIEFSE